MRFTVDSELLQVIYTLGTVSYKSLIIYKHGSNSQPSEPVGVEVHGFLLIW